VFLQPRMAAEVKEDTVKVGNIHVMSPIVEKSKGGAAVDLAVTNDLSVNTYKYICKA
jgi:hypothetical protein